MKTQSRFLAMSPQEAAGREFDVILVSGNAYVDHPAFGTALIGRVLEDAGYSVGIIAQPDWKNSADFRKLGTPELFFGVSSGCVDSMVNNYTPALNKRGYDAYSPGGRPGMPDRAVIVYSNALHSVFPDTPIIIGGIEASLRRFAHYDYWQDVVRQSILADAPADMLVFGMGERQMIEVAGRLAGGEDISDIRDVAGTCIKIEPGEWRSMKHEGYVEIPGFAEVRNDRRQYARAFSMHYREQNPFTGMPVAQPHPKTVIVQNRPAMPLATGELDRIYDLPFTRLSHPSYKEAIPALKPVKFSITSHRGCFAGCSFCAITHHQGRIIQSRSFESMVREVKKLTVMPDFKGIVQDVGGPTANMYSLYCPKWLTDGACRDMTCSPSCGSLCTGHEKQVELLKKLREIPGVRHVYVSSGVRHDLILADRGDYLSELCAHHISGHLKVAPEHVSMSVLDCMRKPQEDAFAKFRQKFNAENRKSGKEQYILPYFMSGHPACTVVDMIELAEYIRDNDLYTEQVQDFTPTPLTPSTCMYHTGLDPFTMKEVHVAKGREKRIQRALLHYKDAKNYWLVYEGLREAGREDLIGNAWKCLIRRSGKP